MTDPVFETFRRKVADVVTVAMNSGHDVGRRIGCRCPLGCHPKFLVSTLIKNPFEWAAGPEFGISDADAREFIVGFETGRGIGPYAELGRLYRGRFP